VPSIETPSRLACPGRLGLLTGDAGRKITGLLAAHAELA